MRSRGTPPPKKRRKNGSLKNGERTRTWVFDEMFTTAGVTSASIGASDCMGWPSTLGGGVARALPGAHANRAHASSAMNGAGAAGRWADACMAVTPCGFRRRLTGAGAAGSAKAVRIRHGRYFVRNVGGTATCVRGGNPRFTLMHLGGNVDWHRDTRCCVPRLLVTQVMGSCPALVQRQRGMPGEDHASRLATGFRCHRCRCGGLCAPCMKVPAPRMRRDRSPTTLNLEIERET